jgi:hypothetical protein
MQRQQQYWHVKTVKYRHLCEDSNNTDNYVKTATVLTREDSNNTDIYVKTATVPTQKESNNTDTYVKTATLLTLM